MKSKRIKQDSSTEESDESRESMESITSSDSESDVSSTLERRYRKKRKRANSSESNSESEAAQKRSKKRKHKKKKKKHSKKKRHVEDSGSEEDSSASDCEIPSKKKKKYKHKHKYDKKLRTSSISDKDFSEPEPEDRRLQSVVKERRSSEESQPSRTYYQKDYQRSPSILEHRSQESEVERFYRGSSRDRNRGQYHQHHFNRNEERYENHHNQQRYDRNHERYVQEYRGPNNSYHARSSREYEEYERPTRYDSRDPPNDRQFHRKPRDEEYIQNQGFDRYNQNEGRIDTRRRDHEDNRDFRSRPGPSEYDRYRDQNYGGKRSKYNEATYPEDRSGEVRRGRPADQERRQDASLRRELRSPQNRMRDAKRDPVTKYRAEDRNRDRLVKEERDHRDRRNDEGRDEIARSRENKPERPRRSPNARKSSPRRSPGNRPGPSDRDRDTRCEPRTEVKRERNSPKLKERKSRFSEADEKNYTWGKTTVKQEGKDPAEKEKPNFGLSGKLTADVNTVNGVVIKYTEPDDAKQPKRRWRFYPFKGDKALPILYIHRQSFFLLGRDKKVVDIHLEHPSISKQHAALQYRATPFTRADGTQGRRVRPYIIDLDSANGTFVNNKKIEPRRYVELLERDVVKFGFSQREYVLLHENSKDDAQDDDQQDPVPGVTTTEQMKQEKRSKMERAADGD